MLDQFGNPNARGKWTSFMQQDDPYATRNKSNNQLNTQATRLDFGDNINGQNEVFNAGNKPTV